MGHPICLKEPKTFNEKIQWLKLYDRRPEYTIMVDKVLAKEYVSSILGKEYIIPTLNVWERAEDIDFGTLPNQFVLKCNHDSATVTIVRDKSSINSDTLISKYRRLLKRDYYRQGREWPYKRIPRRLFAEQYITDGEDDLKDYKFFCFNGTVKCFKIDFDRFIEHHANYYDQNSIYLPFGEKRFPPIPNKSIAMPETLPKMINCAELISKGYPFMRVDFYNVNNRIYFGEITFFPASGFGEFTDEEWDRRMGDWLTLPKRRI